MIHKPLNPICSSGLLRILSELNKWLKCKYTQCFTALPEQPLLWYLTTWAANPPTHAIIPSPLILLTFLPCSCPHHLLCFLSFSSPPSFCSYSTKAQSYSISAAAFAHCTHILKPERPPPPGPGAEAWDWTLECRGISTIYKNTFSYCKAAAWLMFSKHRILDVKQCGKHDYDEAFFFSLKQNTTFVCWSHFCIKHFKTAFFPPPGTFLCIFSKFPKYISLKPSTTLCWALLCTFSTHFFNAACEHEADNLIYLKNTKYSSYFTAQFLRSCMLHAVSRNSLSQVN